MVVNKTEFGVYLGNEQEKVLLPGKYVDEDVETGDSLTVFVYRDSKDRLIATTLEPLITLGEVRVLKVKQNNKIGSFLDWGLEKDILLPYHEQTTRIFEAQECLVAVYVDKVRERGGLAKLKDSQWKDCLSSKDAFIKRLQMERTLELCFEGWRWADLKRWGLLDTEAGIEELEKRDRDFKNFVVGKHRRLPIPRDEVDVSTVNGEIHLNQNPGY